MGNQGIREPEIRESGNPRTGSPGIGESENGESGNQGIRERGIRESGNPRTGNPGIGESGNRGIAELSK